MIQSYIYQTFLFRAYNKKSQRKISTNEVSTDALEFGGPEETYGATSESNQTAFLSSEANGKGYI